MRPPRHLHEQRKAGESNSQGLSHLDRFQDGCRRPSAWPSINKVPFAVRGERTWEPMTQE